MARMLGLTTCFGECALPITVNGGAVYCAPVRRWPSRQARQVLYLMRAIYPAFRKERRKFSTRRKFSGCRAEPDQEALARRRYSKDTSCPAVLWRRRSDGGHKTFPVRGFTRLNSFTTTQRRCRMETQSDRAREEKKRI